MSEEKIAIRIHLFSHFHCSWKSINKKFSGKNKNYDEIVGAAGADNVQSFIEKVTQVIKEAIMKALEERKKEKEAIEGKKQ